MICEVLGKDKENYCSFSLKTQYIKTLNVHLLDYLCTKATFPSFCMPSAALESTQYTAILYISEKEKSYELPCMDFTPIPKSGFNHTVHIMSKRLVFL